MTDGVVKTQSASTTFLVVMDIASALPLRCAFNMKNAIPIPVPNRIEALMMCISLIREYISINGVA
jgi:hypothetical protein